MSLTSAMQSIVNDFKTTAARMFTGFPTGTTHSMCTMTKLYLIQGQVDTVSSAKCSWIQSHRSSHNASSNGCTCSLSSSPLTNCTRRLKKNPTWLCNETLSQCICKTRWKFDWKDSLSSDTLQFSVTLWSEHLLIDSNVVSILMHLCSAFWMTCTI